MNDYCDECSRWQDRIAAAAGGPRKRNKRADREETQIGREK